MASKIEHLTPEEIKAAKTEISASREAETEQIEHLTSDEVKTALKVANTPYQDPEIIKAHLKDAVLSAIHPGNWNREGRQDAEFFVDKLSLKDLNAFFEQFNMTGIRSFYDYTFGSCKIVYCEDALIFFSDVWADICHYDDFNNQYISDIGQQDKTIRQYLKEEPKSKFSYQQFIEECLKRKANPSVVIFSAIQDKLLNKLRHYRQYYSFVKKQEIAAIQQETPEDYKPIFESYDRDCMLDTDRDKVAELVERYGSLDDLEVLLSSKS